jgi:hypothetical protein
VTTIRSATKTTAVKPSGAAKAAQVTLTQLKNADRGLKAKVIGDKLVIKGTARGVETRDPYRNDGKDGTNEPDFMKTEEFGGSIAVDFDQDRMPKFDTSAGYTEKNKWYFAHSVSVGTKKGQSALSVAKALAAKIEGAYDVSIKSRGDAVTMQIVRR